MILRGLHVEHFGCIAGLELDELPDGVVVLSGPNRLGKSTLVRALRACLFDVDHDSTRAKSFAPWNGDGPPKVSVQLEMGGQRYRLTKVFARGKEGSACLERSENGGWAPLERGKEASRKARELLGSDSSEAGLNQLLWLAQGEVELPARKELDGTLEQRLVDVLGALVTGRDLAFKQRLDDKYAEWFGARGTHKPTSRVSRLNQEWEERRRRRDELLAKYAEFEQAIRDLETCADRLPAVEEKVQQAHQQQAALEQEFARTQERRLRYEQAAGAVRSAEQTLQFAQQQYDGYQQAKERWQQAEEEAGRSDAAQKANQDEQQRLAAELEGLTAQRQQARAAEEEHQQTREPLEDRRALLHLSEQGDRLDQTLEQVRTLETMIVELEKQLQETPAPEEPLLQQLRGNRRQAEQLRAQLQAEAIALSVTVLQPTKVALVLDGRPGQPIDLAADQKQTWQLRQSAELELPGVGRVAVERSEKDEARARAAKLEELDRQFRREVAAFQEDPNDEGCVDRLAERRLQQQAAAARLGDLQKQVGQLAPDGAAALAQERNQLDSQRLEIVQRRPELADCRPNAAELAEAEKHYRARLAELQRERQEREQAETAARSRFKQVETRLADSRATHLRARTTADTVLQEMRRLGDDLTLSAALKQAKDALEEAWKQRTEAELTEAEKTVEARLEAAESRRRQQAAELERLTEERSRLRGRLEGSEGLHTRLADAEAAVTEAETLLARETLEADAHKRLHDLFEECRDRQVAQLLSPVGSRVLAWAHDLGLDDYREIRFGDGLLPDGVVRANGHPHQSHALEEDSFGTGEQLGLLVRLALGGLLAREEPAVAILDDPLAHADAGKHRRCLEVLCRVAAGESGEPPAGRLQVLVFTCHPERFEGLDAVRHIDLTERIQRTSSVYSG